MSIESHIPTVDVHEAAKEAGLRYVSDIAPGIRRIKKGKTFSYIDAQNKPVKDDATLRRIKALVIPPAWKDVWICPLPRGHVQATGRDAKGRKQYRYHTQWRAIRDQTKYDKLLEFGKLLPKIRARVLQDLQKKELPREKVLAAVVRVLDLTHMRIGNEAYAQENNSYGLTTLKNTHTEVSGSTVRFRYRGKSGQKQDIEFHDKKLAAIIRACEELPGHELFEYRDDDGKAVDITSEDVNAYLKEITDDDITAKDFRTWGGTVQTALCLFQSGECDNAIDTKKNMTEAIKQVAGFLGNKPATCKKYYIDPRIFSAYQKRLLCVNLSKVLTKNKKSSEEELQPIEGAVLSLLKQTLE